MQPAKSLISLILKITEWAEITFRAILRRFDTVCIVKDYVRSRRQSVREAFVPLHHPPGHAQVDFGEATVEVGGRREKIAFFCLILPHSNVWFVKAYPRETTEAFLDGHVSAFAFLGGVPRSILYDNTTLAVARILGDGTRRRTQAFTHLQSHHLFRDRFGRPGKGNDKGKVEALVKTARRRFMVPIPKVHDLSVLNERLLARCLERLDVLEAGGQAAALLADLEALRDLPASPFEACEHVPGQISSTALVRYRLVDYSAPAAHAHKKVMVKGYVDRVEIALGAEIVARHRRSYVRGDIVYDPLHYLSLLEKKPGALDQAAPLRGWKLDPAFDTLRRLLEARFGHARQARIHPGAAPARRLPGTAGGGRGARRGEAPPDRLRRGQAPAAGPHREAAGASRPVSLSAPAPALRRRHAERRLRHPAGRTGRPWLRPPASCSNIT